MQDNTEIKVIVDGQEFTQWQSYQMESDLLTPADAFSFIAPNTNAEMAGKIHRGDEVKILVDDLLQMTGIVDEVVYQTDAHASTVEITGRDRFASLVDCSAKLRGLKRQELTGLAKTIASPWIKQWRFSADAKERIRHVKIEPGETVLEVIQRVADKDTLTVWMDADGTGVIGKPNYDQMPKYSLFLYTKDNSRSTYNNVIRSSVRKTLHDQYSEIRVYGTSGNTKEDYDIEYHGKAINPDIPHSRLLIITDGSIESHRQAKKIASREMSQRKFESLELSYTVKGHYGYQYLVSGEKKASLWAIDTIADIEDEPAGIQGPYYLVKRRFYGDENGRYTDLTFRQKGVWLA